MNVGIDLGTTFSLIAHLNDRGTPTLFPDLHDANLFRTPSVVHLAGSSALVGQVAEDLLRDDPSLVVARGTKLRLGTDVLVLPRAGAAGLCPTAVASLLLKKLKRDAEAFASEPVERCVVCVPAQFGDAQRRAVRDSVLAAGLPAPRLIDEPVAAAVYHGVKAAAESRTMLVYDLGGGTFDATVLEVSPSGLRVLATDGASDVGGMRFDEMVMDWIADEVRARGADVRRDPGAMQRIRRIAEQLKIDLAKPGRGQVRESALLGGVPLEFMMTRSQFDAGIEPMLMETIAASQRCLSAAGLSWSTVDQVLLCGGSTLLPCVRELILRQSSRPAGGLLHQQPHQAVAFGAALLAGRSLDVDDVTQVASFDLGLRIYDPVSRAPKVQVLIPRNAQLPARHSAVFYTTRMDQTRIVFEIVQARDAGDAGRSLGYFAFGPIAEPRKNYPIELVLTYDLDGLVRVTARDPRTGRELEHVMAEGASGDAAQVARVRAAIAGLRINE
jgi:molecular chaperone DnaK